MNKIVFFFILNPFLGLSQVQIGQDINGVYAGDISGESVAISTAGDVVAIGGSMHDNHKGNVRVYKNINGTWIQVGKDIDGKNSSDRSGGSVSVSADGNIVAIGSHHSNSNGIRSGQVRVFNNIGGNWTQLGQDIIGESAYNSFGFSVSISANGYVVAIGGPQDGLTTPGYVKIYGYNSGIWTQIGQNISDLNLQSAGVSVSLSSDGTIVAVGASSSDTNGVNSGMVRIYKNVSGNWIPMGNDIKGSGGSNSGYRVSISSNGNMLAVFEPNFNTNSSIIKVYEYNSGNWGQVGQNINGEAVGNYMYFGLSLSGDGNILAFGNPNKNQVKVYKKNGTSWSQIGKNIIGKNSTEAFGSSLELSENGENIIIGAPSANRYIGLTRVYNIKNLLLNNDFVLENFNIYPNPTSDKLKISLENNLVLEQITIYNNLSQVVKTSSENIIDVSHLAEGIYFVQVTTDKGKATKKVVVK